jgi:hypothetical protein
VVLSIVEDASVVEGEDSLSINKQVGTLGFNNNDGNMRLIREYSSKAVDCRVFAKERTF